MHKVQLFHFAPKKVRGPMGVYTEERMASCRAESINHGGKDYVAGDDGWIEVPTHVLNDIKNMRHKHPVSGFTKWCTPAEVDEPAALGLVDEVPVPRRRSPSRT